ncbi:hypothetical protein AGROH133_07775 [Agrobacterium tumefaciens]|nr:hypothetical protein AGROH133_07775 [Agrobacterium tumefaciens]
MPLADIAGAAVRIAGFTRGLETDGTAQAATAPDFRHFSSSFDT